MSRIQTNKLIANLELGLLSDTYEFFNVKTSDTHFGKGNNAAKLVDDLTNEKFVLSVVYERGNSFYMMLKKSAENRINLGKAIDRLPGTEKISFENVAISTVPQNIVVQLLLNSLGTYEGKNLGFHNVTGHFYINHPSWTKSKGKQLITLELKVTKDMLLDWSVRTFTSVTKKNDIKFGKKKFNEYPEYVLGKDNILKRIEKGADPDAYIMRQTANKKSSIKFLEIDSFENFQKTKMGVVCDCIDKFNTAFGKMAHIEFDFFDGYQELSVSTKMVKEMEKRFEEMASLHRIVLVDKVLDSTSSLNIEFLKEKLLEHFNCDVSVLKSPKKDAINIILIHKEEEYENKPDPHDLVYKGCAVQHVTIETIAHLMNSDDDSKKTELKSLLDNIMQEALIKEDLVSKRISMVNWQNYNYPDNLIFGLCHKDDDEKKHFYFMTISHDGDFSIAEQENTLFEQNEYQECVDIFSNEDVVGVVKKGNDINVIYDTKLRTIPEIELIKSRLGSGDNKLRNIESREELFPAITDIKCFPYNDHSLCYFSGIIGAGMRRVIPTAANIRMVDAYRYSDLFFVDMLKLMAVTFVRNGQLTVVPFPFKYLREYIAGKAL
ncbi:MAG: hypothetical protein J6T12_01590 [Salinivirgaceae bacterium]|nr:hypothetical protein [Salinivirgaceae bacterium]